MPAAIHDRAMRLLPEMKKTYSPKKAKSVAFAVATQQAHAKGEAPKKWHGKPFGTPKGKREAKQKFDKPKSEYKSLKEGALVMYRASLSKLAMQGVPGAQAMIVKEGQAFRLLRGILGARTGRFLNRLGRGLMFRSGSPVAFMRGAGGEPAMFRALAGTTGAGAASNILAARPNLRARIGQWLQRTGQGLYERGLERSLSVLPPRARQAVSGAMGQAVPDSALAAYMTTTPRPLFPPSWGTIAPTVPGGPIADIPILGRAGIPALAGTPARLNRAVDRLRILTNFGPIIGRPRVPIGSRIPIGAPETSFRGWAVGGKPATPVRPYVGPSRELIPTVPARRGGGHGTSKVAQVEPELTEGQRRRRRYQRRMAMATMGLLGGVGGFSGGMAAGDNDWRYGALGAGLGALGGGALGYGLGTLGDYEARMQEQAIAERIAAAQMAHQRKSASLNFLLEEGERLMKQAADEWMPPVEQERPTTLPYTGPGPFSGRHIVGGRDIGEELYRDLGIMGSGGLRPVDTDPTGDATSSPYGGLGRGTTKAAQANLRETSEPHYPGLSAVPTVKPVKPLKAVKPMRTAAS